MIKTFMSSFEIQRSIIWFLSNTSPSHTSCNLTPTHHLYLPAGDHFHMGSQWGGGVEILRFVLPHLCELNTHYWAIWIYTWVDWCWEQKPVVGSINICSDSLMSKYKCSLKAQEEWLIAAATAFVAIYSLPVCTSGYSKIICETHF